MKLTRIEPAAMLLPHILTRLAGHPAPVFWFRLSGLGWCPEKQHLSKDGHQEAPQRPDIIRKQQIGHALEDWTLADAEKAYGKKIINRQAEIALCVTNDKGECQFWLGHIDGTVDLGNGLEIVDAKATGGFQFNSKYMKMAPDGVTPELDNERTIQAYKAQLGGYSRGFSDVTGGRLIFRNRDTSSWDVVWEDVDYYWPIGSLLPLAERGFAAHFNRDTQHVEPWECQSCGFSAVCSKKKQPEQKQNEGYELLSQYRKAEEEFAKQPLGTVAEYEANRAKIDAIMDKARKALKELPAADRKPFHDGFSLSWSKADRLTITNTRK